MLEKKELVSRTKIKTDKRRQLIEITASGKETIAENSERAAQIVAGFKSTLGEERYELLLDILGELSPQKD